MHERPAELLQRLIRFDTTNPPGNERACIEWIKGVIAHEPPCSCQRRCGS